VKFHGNWGSMQDSQLYRVCMIGRETEAGETIGPGSPKSHGRLDYHLPRRKWLRNMVGLGRLGGSVG